MNKEEKKPKNPPAFPIPSASANGGPVISNHQEGMSLRDFFANSAMAVILSNNGADLDANEIASDAYLYADAMLKAREA